MRQPGSRAALLSLASCAAQLALSLASKPELLSSFELDGQVWSAYLSNDPETNGKPFFVAPDGSTTWIDPRKALLAAESRLTGTVALLIALGVVTLFATAFSAYLAVKYPKYWASLGVKSKRKRTTLAVKYSPATNGSPQRKRTTSVSPTRESSSSPVGGRTQANGKKAN